MSRPSRRPRPIPRAVEPTDEVRTGPRFARIDRRQADMFRPAPAFIPPCKPVLRDHVPVGPLWQYEIKLDGYRIQAHAREGTVTLFTKSGRDYTDRLPTIADAVMALGREAILDGEAVILDAEGAPDFFRLHADVAAGHAPGAILVAFDVLSLDGEDLRTRPLTERQTLLDLALAGAGHGLAVAERHTADGPELFKAACGFGLEGIVAKRTDKPYRSGYRDDWVKLKCTTVEAFAVIGFDPAGRRGVAALRVAKLGEGSALRPCGSVGSGIGEGASRALRAALDAGEPVVIDVEHRGVTPAGELRAPVFKGRHVDKA